MNKKTAVVSGASGFIGLALVKELLISGYKVYALVRGEKKRELPKHVDCIPIDYELDSINSVSESIPKLKNGVFFHLAWSGSVGQDRSDSDLQLKNVQWSLESLRVAHKIGCTKFEFVSSIAEDETVAVCKSDGSSPDTHYFYGASKFASMLFLKIECTKLKMEMTCVKLANVYGVNDFSRRMLNATLLNCLAGNSPSFTSGTQNYDFVYISDAVLALRLIAEKGRPATEYVVGSGQPDMLKNFLIKINSEFFPSLIFKFGNIPFTGVNQSLDCFSIQKTKVDTGYEPKVSFSEGVGKLVEWLKQNKNKVC